MLNVKKEILGMSEAQLVKRETPGFSSGHDPQVKRLSPGLGSLLSGKSASPLSLSPLP